MANLLRIYNIRFVFDDMRKRVIAAIGKTAYAIMSEPSTTPNHSERIKWAKRALKTTNQVVDDLLWYIALDAAIAEAGNQTTDEQILDAVSRNIDLSTTV